MRLVLFAFGAERLSVARAAPAPLGVQALDRERVALCRSDLAVAPFAEIA